MKQKNYFIYEQLLKHTKGKNHAVCLINEAELAKNTNKLQRNYICSLIFLSLPWVKRKLKYFSRLVIILNF